jgi:hypothetical protein
MSGAVFLADRCGRGGEVEAASHDNALAVPGPGKVLDCFIRRRNRVPLAAVRADAPRRVTPSAARRYAIQRPSGDHLAVTNAGTFPGIVGPR